MTKPEVDKAQRSARRTRVDARLPVNVGGRPGVTRDISSTGMFIIQSSQQKPGSRIDFWLDMDSAEGKYKLCCEGEVVRVEEIYGKVGIGVKILSQVKQNYR
jgi:hypothetical protein